MCSIALAFARALLGVWQLLRLRALALGRLARAHAARLPVRQPVGHDLGGRQDADAHLTRRPAARLERRRRPDRSCRAGPSALAARAARAGPRQPGCSSRTRCSTASPISPQRPATKSWHRSTRVSRARSDAVHRLRRILAVRAARPRHRRSRLRLPARPARALPAATGTPSSSTPSARRCGAPTADHHAPRPRRNPAARRLPPGLGGAYYQVWRRIPGARPAPRPRGPRGARCRPSAPAWAGLHARRSDRRPDVGSGQRPWWSQCRCGGACVRRAGGRGMKGSCSAPRTCAQHHCDAHGWCSDMSVEGPADGSAPRVHRRARAGHGLRTARREAPWWSGSAPPIEVGLEARRSPETGDCSGGARASLAGDGGAAGCWTGRGEPSHRGGAPSMRTSQSLILAVPCAAQTAAVGPS